MVVKIKKQKQDVEFTEDREDESVGEVSIQRQFHQIAT